MKGSAGKQQAVRSNPMLAEERRQHILDIARNEGRVLVRELSRTLRISSVTVRKDLEALQAMGLLRRSHGGALPMQPGTIVDSPLRPKKRSVHMEEDRIAAAAAGMVQEGQSVIVDSGSITAAIAHSLRRFSRLTVVTNALNIALDLADTEFEVIVTGGTLSRNSLSLTGPIAGTSLASLRTDVLFLGIDAFDPDAGVHYAMLHAAAMIVVVGDSASFTRRSLSRIVAAPAIHHIITDGKLSSPMREALASLKIPLTLV